MAPVLFNLYSCLLIEWCNERVRDLEGVGVYLRYKYDKKLFRRYVKNTCEMECQFADDAALLATTKSGAELATIEYVRVTGDFGLTLSIPKTKVMAVGRIVTEEDKQPLNLGDNEIESVDVFQYLGYQVKSSGRMTADVEKWITKASKACGALRKTVFQDHDLNTNTKRSLPTLCDVCPSLWVGTLGTPQEKSEED